MEPFEWVHGDDSNEMILSTDYGDFVGNHVGGPKFSKHVAAAQFLNSNEGKFLKEKLRKHEMCQELTPRIPSKILMKAIKERTDEVIETLKNENCSSQLKSDMVEVANMMADLIKNRRNNY